MDPRRNLLRSCLAGLLQLHVLRLFFPDRPFPSKRYVSIPLAH